MEPITENIIKKIALRFFRHYYKFRLRYEGQPIVAKYDLEGAGGIIADGYYSFKKPDGKPFIATFEATSKESKDEVLFKPQEKILFWDGLAVATVCTGFLAGLNLLYQFHELDERKILARLGLLAGAMILSFFLFRHFAKNFRRYRYIYAIEQFKKYHADEQWIAIADDVFDEPADKHLEELKSQCVFNGFGLMMIDRKLTPKILVTPARQEVFTGSRQTVEFQSKARLLKAGQDSVTRSWWSFLGYRLPNILKKDESVLRYRKSFYHQMLISGVSIILIGTMFFKEMQNAGYQSVDPEAFRNEIAKSKSNNVPEQPEFWGDSASTPVQRNIKDRFWLKDDSLLHNERPVSDSNNEKPGSLFLPDCSRYAFNNKIKYIILDSEHQTGIEARQRLDYLKSLGLEASAFHLSCFFKAKKGYGIYIGLIYNSKPEAELEMKKILAGNFKIETSWSIASISRKN